MIDAMMRRRHFNPGPGLADFWHEFRKPTPYRWPILALSFLLTFALLYVVMSEKYYLPPERPEVTYISSFAPGRSDDEIIASNLENQKRKEQRQAELDALAERKKEMYRALARASGMDVEAMERKIAEDRAREQAAIEARRRAAQTRKAARDGVAPKTP